MFHQHSRLLPGRTLPLDQPRSILHVSIVPALHHHASIPCAFSVSVAHTPSLRLVLRPTAIHSGIYMLFYTASTNTKMRRTAPPGAPTVPSFPRLFSPVSESWEISLKINFRCVPSCTRVAYCFHFPFCFMFFGLHFPTPSCLSAITKSQFGRKARNKRSNGTRTENKLTAGGRPAIPVIASHTTRHHGLSHPLLNNSLRHKNLQFFVSGFVFLPSVPPAFRAPRYRHPSSDGSSPSTFSS